MCWQSIDLDGSLIFRGFLVEGDRPFASVPPNLLGVSPMSAVLQLLLDSRSHSIRCITG